MRRAFSSSLPKTVTICGTVYPTDSMYNIPASILARTASPLTTDPASPLSHLRARIESHLLSPIHASLPPLTPISCPNPVVSSHQNFTSLLIPSDHPSRAPSDTYYINATTLLRTHTSAHQEDLLKERDAFVVSADVYRRDQIDHSHFPVFHQMEGVKLFDRTSPSTQELMESGRRLMDGKMKEMFGIDSINAIQPGHSEEDVMRVSLQLRETLEGLFSDLFKHEKNLEYRWVAGTFPFTSPSWELEVRFNDTWLELCGCGIIKQPILASSNKPHKIGWAFGLGLERIAMIRHRIPDIRLFWSKDERFLKQFQSEDGEKEEVAVFKAFSKHPACYKDISFYTSSGFEDNDLNDLVRDVAGDLVESCERIDTFVKEGRVSKCYRIQYRAMDRNCTNEEIDIVQDKVRARVVEEYGVELR